MKDDPEKGEIYTKAVWTAIRANSGPTVKRIGIKPGSPGLDWPQLKNSTKFGSF